MYRFIIILLIICPNICQAFQHIDNTKKVREVPTADTLRRVTGSSERDVIKLLGYNEPGDGAAGPIRHWDSTSKCADNGASCIDPFPLDEKPGRWIWIHSGPVQSNWYGFGTPTENTLGLIAAIKDADEIQVVPNTYDPVIIKDDHKILNMATGVTFRLPDNSVSNKATSGPAVFKITGDNVIINGDFTVDGNRDKNDSSNFPTSFRVGSVSVTGNYVHLNGTVRIMNPYYIGFQADGGNVPGQEVKGLEIRGIEVIDPAYFATLFWSLDGWHVEKIVVKNNLSRDGRVRTGTEESAKTRCSNGTINKIVSNDIVVIEANTNNLRIGEVFAQSFKLEKSSGVFFNHFYSSNCKKNAYAFAIIESKEIRGNRVHVDGYDGLQPHVIVFNGAFDSIINEISVNGTLTSATDVTIRKAEDLSIDKVYLTNPKGAGKGFHYDYDKAYAPQRGIRIGELSSSGHRAPNITIDADAIYGNEGINIGRITKTEQ